MTTDEYVPSDDDVRIEYVLAHQGLESQLDAGEAYDRWLASHDARVRRDAAREALDGLASDVRDDWHRSHHWVTQPIEEYRNTHYPEETP